MSGKLCGLLFFKVNFTSNNLNFKISSKTKNNKLQITFGGREPIKVKVELNCPTRGISRVEINTPQSLDYATSGLCGNTFLNNDGSDCSLHYEHAATGQKICSDSSEVLGDEWRVKKVNVSWQLDLQVSEYSLKCSRSI